MSGVSPAGALLGTPHPEAVVLIGDAADCIVGAAGASRAAPVRDGRRLALNAAAGGASNLVKIAVQLVMLPLMAHLLGPAEFGLYALALPTVAFFMALADGGLGISLARERGDAPEIWSTAFWLLLGVGVALALGVSGWGLALAAVAGEPRLARLMPVLSLSFVFLTSCVLPSARLTRANRLFVISAADLSSALAGAVVAVGLAVAGWGAMSLAAQYAVGFLIRAVILNAAAFVRPTRVFRLDAIRDHLSTGSSLLGGRLCDFCGRLVENLAYGRIFGAASLGTYTFANQAPRFLCEAASGPIWAALYAQALREDEETVAAIHARLMRLLGVVVLPLAFILAACAPEVLHMLLGARWDEASPVLRVLLPFYALQVLAGQSGAVLVAAGRGWLLFWLTGLTTVGRVASVGVGVWSGQEGVAWGVALTLAASSAILFLTPARAAGRSAWPLFRVLAPSLASSTLGGALCFAMVQGRPASLPSVAAAVAAGAAGYALALVLLDWGNLRGDIAASIDIVRRRQAR